MPQITTLACLCSHMAVEVGDTIDTQGGPLTVSEILPMKVSVALPGGTLSASPSAFDMAYLPPHLLVARPNGEAPISHAEHNIVARAAA